MLRVLRAFAWMRWRVLMNSLERTSSRDTLERFSLAIEQLGPIIAGIVMVPSALLLAGVAAHAGWAVGSGQPAPITFQILRFVLFGALVLSVVGPIMMPGAERANAVRLLLLPIPRQTLYAAQLASTLSDPWVLLAMPIVIALPIGLAAAGAWGAALLAVVTGLLLLAAIVGSTSIASTLMQLVARDRRRGELIALVFILVVPLIGLLPAMMQESRRTAERAAGPRSRGAPSWVVTAREYGQALVPSEIYVGTARDAASGSLRVIPLVAITAGAGLLHVVGLFLFGKLLDSAGGTSSRRRAAPGRAWAGRLPGLSAPASAVALAQLRLALRTPRGRSVLLSPLIVFVMFAIMMSRNRGAFDFGLVTLESGLGLATFGGAVSLISVLPFAMNQFTIDGAGLTLALLAPLDERDWLRGKAVGNALIVMTPASLALLGAGVLFPGGSLALWSSIPLGLLATYLLIAPAAALFSALFPRAVDLNSIGRGSNAHGAAGFLGLIGFAAAGAPSVLVVVVATRVLERPGLAPWLLLAWCAVCLLLARILFAPVRQVVASRRENLGMTV